MSKTAKGIIPYGFQRAISISVGKCARLRCREVQSAMKPSLKKSEDLSLPDDLQALIAKAKVKKKRGLRNQIILAVVSVSLLTMHDFARDAHRFQLAIFLSIAVLCTQLVILLHAYLQDKRGIYGISEEEIERLSTLNDKSVIGALLDVSQNVVTKKFSPQRKETLRRLLSLLTSEDADLLTRKQKIYLVRLIRSDGEEITFAALRALKQVGDESTVSALKRWKFNQLGMRINPDVEAGIEACLRAIANRHTVEVVNSQLLRPTSPPAQTGTLLRPATSTLDTETDTLLRAEIGRKDE